ncbi:MAG: 4Fe-4S binding protein [Anaerovoracaceae bacterium]|jgi:ferredoxin-type protein NapH
MRSFVKQYHKILSFISYSDVKSFEYGVTVFGDYNLISKLETYKYLSTELLMMMFFWVVFIGRGYCYYCPIGTTIGLLGKISGQKIVTNKTKCIDCDRCNLACPMTIDIKSKALKGEPVTSQRCVGCGHCVDVCITENLAYTTTFLSMICKNTSKYPENNVVNK